MSSLIHRLLPKGVQATAVATVVEAHSAGVLSLAKLRVGKEAYWLSGVAESLHAYYTGAGEAPGVWIGGGAARLGLDGEVAPDDLRAVLAGMRPGSGGLSPNGTAIRPRAKRVPGFDATFKVPKSASVLYAVSDDPRVQGAVIDAGNHAAHEAIAWLEREAIEVQRGSHNKAWLERTRAELIEAGEDPGGVGPKRLKTSGVVAAAFRHRASRAGDPLLHWHVLIANLVEGADGKWSAFAHPDLYRHARAAGEVFQAAFRAELTRTLGIEWRPGRHVPEIAGIPQSLLDLFSKRRAEVEEWLEATGTPADAAGQQAAVLATRRNKPEQEGERLDAQWKVEADEAGWGPDKADELIGRCHPRLPVGVGEVWRLAEVGFDETGTREDYERVVTPDEWIADVLRRDLTVHITTFTDSDVAQAVAQRLGGGATVDTMERLVDLVLASDQVLTVRDGDGNQRYTSREMVEVEHRFIDVVTADQRHPAVDAAAVATAVTERPDLGDDQRAAVERLCAATGAVAVLIGPAGTGKTFTLDAVRDAYERSGYRVIGAGPSARAARELEAGAGIPSRTLHTLDGEIQRGLEELDGHTVLVIDEAGMADIRTLEEVVAVADQAGTRVLLAGDQHQLPSVGAGGGFGYAAEHAGTVAQLTVNRRQREPWEQEALAALRNGNVPAAVAAYLEHDRVVVTTDADTMVADAIARWAAAIDNGLRPVMLAGTNQLVDRLNRSAIDHLVARGLLPEAHAGYGTGRYRVGDRITVRRNSEREQTIAGDHIGVANGQLGSVTDIVGGRLVVRLDARPDVEVVLDERYLARGGHVSHGYALTTQRAQGGTWDLSITVGANGLYREAAYTDLSRGAEENWLIVTNPELARLIAELDPDLDRHDTGIDPDEDVELAEDLTERMSKSRAKHLAHSVDPDVECVDALARTEPLIHLEQRLGEARQAARLATQQVGADARQLARKLATAEHTARHAAVGQRVKALDRHNIGTIEDLNDQQGTVHVVFISPDGDVGERNLPWSQVVILDRAADARELTATAQTALDRYRGGIESKITRWNDTVTALGSYPDEVDHMQRAIHQHVTAAAAQLTGTQPDWLDQLIGPRPADPIGETTWDTAATEIARWRSLHGITERGLGTPPAESDLNGQWAQLSRRLAATRNWLAAAGRHEPSWSATRSHRDLVERRHTLEAILDTAPDDTRGVIVAVRAGQLALTDIDEILRAADTARDARKRWILEHWPHVVEHAEVTAALEQQQWGPDRQQLLGDLDEYDLDPPLEHAIDADEPWLQPALCALAIDERGQLNEAQIDWLNDVATYRDNHRVTTRDPLGALPDEPARRRQFDELVDAIDHISPVPEQHAVDLGVEI
jgi:hypothetical protein